MVEKKQTEKRNVQMERKYQERQESKEGQMIRAIQIKQFLTNKDIKPPFR